MKSLLKPPVQERHIPVDARPCPAAPRRWQHRAGSGTVKGAAPGRRRHHEGVQLQAGRALLKPSTHMIRRTNPAAPGKGVHERHETPHFKPFLTLVYTFRVHLFGTSRIYRWPTRAAEMNECMFAGRREQRHAQSERTQSSRAHYSARSLAGRTTAHRCQTGGRYSVSVSSMMVKGPSFTSSTCMFAPNVPVATRETS